MQSSTFVAHDGHFPDYLLKENQADTEENRALYRAAERGDLRAVKDAIQKGGKPNFFFHTEDHKNSLHIAAEKGYVEIVEYLLENGAVSNAVSAKDHASALILASTQPNAAVVRRLIRAGAHLDAENGYGNTALHEACYCGHFDVIKELIDAGAKINAVNHKGSTPLHMFCYGEPADTHTVAMARYLLDNGAHINVGDSRGMTPLLVVCSTGREDLVDFFLEMGADRTARDASGRGPAAIAIFYHHEHIARMFGAEAKDSYGDDNESKSYKK